MSDLSPYQMVMMYHLTCGLPVRSQPVYDITEKQLWLDRIDTEWSRYLDAEDQLGVALSLGELAYVLIGAGMSHGVVIGDKDPHFYDDKFPHRAYEEGFIQTLTVYREDNYEDIGMPLAVMYKQAERLGFKHGFNLLTVLNEIHLAKMSMVVAAKPNIERALEFS